MLGEVQTREFAEVLDSGSVVGAGSGFLVPKIPKIDTDSTVTQSCRPAVTVADDALKSACIVSVYFSVGTLLLWGRSPEIASTIVKCVAVSMIGIFAIYLSMHGYGWPPHRIKTTCTGLPCSIPIPLVKPVVIADVYNCVLTLCERNQAVRCIRRLDNRVAFHAAFHGSTSNGIVKVQPYFSMRAM